MNFGQASGEHRVARAIHEAMNTPLLFEYDAKNTKKVLLALYTSHTNQIIMEETREIKDFMETFDDEIDFIWGAFYDDSLGDEVKITLLATCSDESVVPREIETLLDKDGLPVPTTVGKNRVLSIADLDDESVLKTIQNEPAYQRG